MYKFLKAKGKEYILKATQMSMTLMIEQSMIPMYNGMLLINKTNE